VEIIGALVAAGADPNGRAAESSTCWVTPLSRAASLGNIDEIRSLLNAGAAIQPTACSKLVAGWLRPPVIELLSQHGLDLNAVDQSGRNELHLALAPPVVPQPDSIEYLIRAGVSLNARDHAGKTPLAYWRQPREYEILTWLVERLTNGPEFRQERENRAKISALLERSQAAL